MDLIIPELTFERYETLLPQVQTMKIHGRVTQVIGLTIESEGPLCQLGEMIYIYDKHGRNPSRAEVVGFKGSKVLSMPLGDMGGISPGCEVRGTGKPLMVKVGPKLLGRVLDGLGEPIDGKGPLIYDTEYPIYNSPPNPFLRPRIEHVLPLGVRVLDGLLTFGKGQRMGIFAGSGVGKSTTMSMIARATAAQVTVLALVGERGRELRDFLERDLGEEGLKRSVVCVATSDTPSLARMKAAYTGTAVAEYFRDQGMDVMLMMDSVTRFAMAQREIGLALGEPPATKGYTPSCFALLPKLMERPGTSQTGTITAMYTVLVDGDDMNEPIADAVRGILDGHIVLNRKIAHKGRYPAVDVLQSVSRLFHEICSHEHMAAAMALREVLATYADTEDLIAVGQYKPGHNKKVDYCVQKYPDVIKFLKQPTSELSGFQDAVDWMMKMMADAKGILT